ncbi:MAG TPA: ATP-binding protein, partial [Chitinophagaceae bacterium]|nr:ATP-binding protein [Chitinophagaceae bacterium]
YLSNPKGQSLGVLNLKIEGREITHKIVEHWRKGLVYSEHWNKEQFISWMQSMIDLKQISNKEMYQGEENLPDSFHLYFVPFTQGMLYVGNTISLTNDEVQLVKSLAEAFAIAYARYEDFKQLEDAKNKVEATLSELRRTQSQLIQSEKMASLGELTAGIAHEIQNPLNFVNNFSDINKELLVEMEEKFDRGYIAEAKALARELKENEQKIMHHGKRADGIVKGMLQHFRASSEKKELTDINQLTDEYLRLSYHGLRAKDNTFTASFKTDFDKTIGKVAIVPQDIGRVLLNLFNNAFYSVNKKKTQQGRSFEPTVTVTTIRCGDKVEISIRDNGTGIPQNALDKIFQPFYTTKPSGQGTGLGLSISYDIIKAHDAALIVESKEGEYATFVITLPA